MRRSRGSRGSSRVGSRSSSRVGRSRHRVSRSRHRVGSRSRGRLGSRRSGSGGFSGRSFGSRSAGNESSGRNRSSNDQFERHWIDPSDGSHPPRETKVRAARVFVTTPAKAQDVDGLGFSQLGACWLTLRTGTLARLEECACALRRRKFGPLAKRLESIGLYGNRLVASANICLAAQTATGALMCASDT